MSENHSEPTPPNGRSYDLAVVGAGSAGFSASITAAEQGAQVALIGHGAIGGTCVNIGCVPSKALIRAAESLHQARASSRFAGIEGTAQLSDWGALIAQKDDLVANLRQAKYADLLPAYNTIAYMDGPARLTEGGLAINGHMVRSDRVVITTGARPSLPPIPGIEDVDVLTSTSALDLKELPKSLLVVGGGFIGVELAQMFARAGVAVTIVDLVPILSVGEPEISAALADYFRAEGIVVRERVKTTAIRKTDRGVALDIEAGGKAESIAAERVLIATGRKPNVEDLGLAEAGVAQHPNGSIQIDDRMRTSRPGVYAAGDVTGQDMFVYMAAYGAKLAAKNALNGDGLRYDNAAMPAVVFTDPQVASVGLTEKVAKQQGIDVRISVLPLEHVPRALAARDTRGLIKLVADASSDRLIGAHILAPEGGDSIQTAALAIKTGMTVRDLAETIFPYLTTVEGLKLAAQTFDKDVSKLSCCAG